MDYIKKFKEFLKEEEKEDKDKIQYQHSDEELGEANVTGNLDGGEGPPKTPYAFGDDSPKSKKKEKENAETATGFSMVKDSMYKQMMSILNETSYREFKKDPTSTPQQKVNRGIQEVNKMLGLMEKIVNNNIRLKTEMGVNSNHFWKSTGRRFAKINERMTRIANRLKELSQ
tara:strand:+ start:4205 stop:4720 length:516 start_codon:yes stop_codon:yes gene_type:complete